MKFPRETVRVGNCLAVTHSRGPKKGQPLLGSRPSAMFEGEKWSAYRLSYHLNVAPIPCHPINLKEGLILHSCDQEWCIFPDHLSCGTQSQNVKEMFERTDAKAKLSVAGRGRKHPEEVKQKIASAHLGREFSDDHKRKISEARKNFWERNPALAHSHAEKMRAARGI